jgi:hypothetical protein
MRVRVLFCLLVVGLLTACGSGKKKKETPVAPVEAPVSIGDFIKIFPVVKTPFTFGDSVLSKKTPDSLRLSRRSVRQLISDSLYSSYFGDDPSLHLYAVGKIADKTKGNYLLVKSVSDQGKGGYLLYFDKHQKLLGSLPLVTASNGEHTLSYGKLDAKLNISVITQSIKAGGFKVIQENAYAFMDDGTLALMMTNTNDESPAKKVYNPIDTFPHRYKWAGDYIEEPNNIVSLRDGPNAREYRFFIHFTSEDGTCKGDVKGVAEITGENKIRFTERVGTCGIEFKFSDNRVTLREVGGCGAYRGMNCFFDGSYTRKKLPQRKKKK